MTHASTRANGFTLVATELLHSNGIKPDPMHPFMMGIQQMFSGHWTDTESSELPFEVGQCIYKNEIGNFVVLHSVTNASMAYQTVYVIEAYTDRILMAHTKLATEGNTEAIATMTPIYTLQQLWKTFEQLAAIYQLQQQ